MSLTNRPCMILAALLLTFTLVGCGASNTGDTPMATGLFSKDLAALESAVLADDRGAQNRTLLMVAVDRLKPNAVAELLA